MKHLYFLISFLILPFFVTASICYEISSNANHIIISIVADNDRNYQTNQFNGWISGEVTLSWSTAVDANIIEDVTSTSDFGFSADGNVFTHNGRHYQKFGFSSVTRVDMNIDQSIPILDIEIDAAVGGDGSFELDLFPPNEIGNGTATLSNFAIGEQFAFGSCNTTLSSPLPVELLNFTATPENETILLDWNTATETNNKGFELQRSPDGQQWQTITFINGHGNKITPTHYDYIDRPNASGTFYYRLQQIDFDGAIDFSNIVSAKLSSLIDDIIVFPNPTGTKDLTIQFPGKGNYQIRVFNVYGKLLFNNNMIVNGKAERKKLVLSDWQSGIYLLEITTGDLQFTQVLIKQIE